MNSNADALIKLSRRVQEAGQKKEDAVARIRVRDGKVVSVEWSTDEEDIRNAERFLPKE